MDEIPCELLSLLANWRPGPELPSLSFLLRAFPLLYAFPLSTAYSTPVNDDCNWSKRRAEKPCLLCLTSTEFCKIVALGGVNILVIPSRTVRPVWRFRYVFSVEIALRLLLEKTLLRQYNKLACHRQEMESGSTTRMDLLLVGLLGEFPDWFEFDAIDESTWERK